MAGDSSGGRRADDDGIRLIGSAGGGPLSETEFDEIMRAHFDDIWRYALRRCSTTADADDVAAEVFATLWRRRDDVPPRGEVRLWLFGVARNVLANQRRSHQRRERLGAKLKSQPLQVSEIQHQDDTLWQAMAMLSAEERDLLLMRAQDGLPVADIATLLGCTRTAASLRLRRARKRLANLLDALEDGNSEKSSSSAKHVGPTGHVRPEPKEKKP